MMLIQKGLQFRQGKNGENKKTNCTEFIIRIHILDETELTGFFFSKSGHFNQSNQIQSFRRSENSSLVIPLFTNLITSLRVI